MDACNFLTKATLGGKSLRLRSPLWAASCVGLFFCTIGRSQEALLGSKSHDAIVHSLEAPPSRQDQALVPLPGVDEGLSLDEIESRALACNPTLRRAMALVSAARGNCLQVGLKPNPSVGYEGQQLGSGGVAEQHGVTLSQEIPMGGKLRLNRAVARSEIEIAQQSLAVQRMRVLTDVRSAYWQALIGQRQVALADELVLVGEKGVEAVEALFAAKEVGRVDLLQAKLEVDQAEIQSQDARNRFDAAWHRLAAVVGDPTLTPHPLAGDPLSLDSELRFDESLAQLLVQSPEIGAAVAELQRARRTWQRAVVQPIPNLTVQGLVNWQDNGIGGKPDGGVAVSVPLPIFDRNQGAIHKAECEIAAARHAIAKTQLDLQHRLAPVFESYASARQQSTRFRTKILPNAQESLDLARHAYQAGEMNFTELLTAQRTFAATHRSYLDAVLRLRLAEAEIEGLLLSGSLD